MFSCDWDGAIHTVNCGALRHTLFVTNSLLAETIKRYLIGDKEVRITYSHPFGIIISTLKDETLGIYNGNTSSEVILTAATPTMPMGFIMTHIVVDNFGVFTIGSSIIGTGELG